jgi:hypothetical protein
MIVAVLVGLAIATIPPAGGSYSALSKLRLRGTSLILFGFVIQTILISVDPTVPHVVAVIIHLGSYALAVVFCALNRQMPWIGVIAVGGGLNLVAVAANGGVMPASPWATSVAGLTHRGAAFANSSVVDHPKLAFLGDVLAIPKSLPLANVFSVGDVLLVVGCVLALHTAAGCSWAQPRELRSR